MTEQRERATVPEATVPGGAAAPGGERERLRLLALNLRREVGPLAAAAGLHKLYGQRRIGLFARATRVDPSWPPAWPGLPGGEPPREPTAAELAAAEREIEAVRRAGAAFVTWLDPEYPGNLRSIQCPPPVLYCRGALAARDWLAVAIVGSRRASDDYLEFAATLGYELAKAGVTVVSGLARGVDRAVHEGALAAGGRTLAVLGTGIDVVYPRGHERLADAVAASGALLTYYPVGTPPLPHHFPARNWVVAGLARVTVVVQGTRQSGALITARYAAAQGRDVMAVPGHIGSALSEGPNELIRDGAGVVLSARDVLDSLRHELCFAGVDVDQVALPFGRDADGAESLAARIKGALREEVTDAGKLAARLGVPVDAVQRELVLLEIAGEVASLPGGRFRLVRRGGGPA